MARTDVDEHEHFPPRPGRVNQFQEVDERLGFEDSCQLGTQSAVSLVWPATARRKTCAVLRMPNVPDTGLRADAIPRLVERCRLARNWPRLCIRWDDATACGGFFLMRGSFSRSHSQPGRPLTCACAIRRSKAVASEKASAYSSRCTWWLWYRPSKGGAPRNADHSAGSRRLLRT